MQIRHGTRGTDHSNRITRVPCFTENYTPYLSCSPSPSLRCLPLYPSSFTRPIPRLKRRVRFSCVQQTPRCACLCSHCRVAYHRLSNYRGIVAARGKLGNRCSVMRDIRSNAIRAILFTRANFRSCNNFSVNYTSVITACDLHIIWRDTGLLAVFPSLFAARQV